MVHRDVDPVKLALGFIMYNVFGKCAIYKNQKHH